MALFTKAYLGRWTDNSLVVLQEELHLAAGEAMYDGTSTEEIEDILQAADAVEVELSRRTGIPLC